MTTDYQSPKDVALRQLVIERARERYIDTGRTRNITEALRLYLDNDATADEKIPLFISTPERHQLREALKFARPQCDECGKDLFLQGAVRDQTGKSYPTAWNCKNCGMIYYSDKTLKEWLKELQDETRKQNLRDADEPDGEKLSVGRQEPEI